MKHIAWAFLLLGLLSCLPAQAQDSLRKAEDAYRQGRYSAALTEYENLLRTSPNDPFVYYNIGNCYFKMGSKGLAAANYYRAFKLNPRDNDIRHNLSLALAAGGEKFVPSGVPEALHKAFYGLSQRELTGLTFLMFWICCAIGCIWLLTRHFKYLWLFTCLCALLTGCWYWARAQQDNQSLAVVALPTAEIRSGPGTNFPASAGIAQGHLVTIEDQRDSWYEVIVKSQGIKGWIEQSAVEKI